MSSCTGSFTETQLGEVRFPEISAPILEKVCQYFYWSLQFARLVSFSNSLAFGVVKLCTFGLGARGEGAVSGCIIRFKSGGSAEPSIERFCKRGSSMKYLYR